MKIVIMGNTRIKAVRATEEMMTMMITAVPGIINLTGHFRKNVCTHKL